MRTYQLNTNAFRLIVLTTLLLSSIATTVPVRALPAQSMWIEPSSLSFSTNTTTVGHKFNVTIWLNVTTPANSWQVFLTYKKSHLNATRADYTGIGQSLWSGGLPTDSVEATFGSQNATDNYVLHGEVLKSGANKTGAGSLSWIEFQIIKAPAENETLSSELRLDAIGIFNTQVLDSGFNALPVTMVGTAYTYAWVPLTPPTIRPWLEVLPGSVTETKPSKFNVGIYIRDVNASWNLIGAQFSLTYNSTFLDPINVTAGPFMSNSSWAIHGTFQTWRVDPGNLVYGELILPNDTGIWDLPQFPSGGGLLATITFQTLLHQATSFNISATPVFGQHFLDQDMNYIPFNPPKNCLYNYSPLPVPIITVDPSLYTASHVGEQFNVNITITDLVADWKLTFAEFKLMWNEKVLALVNGTEGNFMKSFGNTTVIHEEGPNYVKANITLTPTSVYPSGSGTLATLQFNVTRTPGRCPLTLNETKLLDFEMKQLLDTTQNGYYRLYERLIHPIVWGGTTYNVVTVSSASVTPVPMAFIQSHGMLNFNITDEDGTTGFVNVTIPKALLDAAPSGWWIIVGGTKLNPVVTENATHTTLSLNVSLSTKSVYILGTSVIPEITLNALLIAFFAVTVISLATARKVRSKKRELLTQIRQ